MAEENIDEDMVRSHESVIVGEMSAEDMRTTAMDPNSRILVRFTIDDAQEASEFITAMMGDDTSFRKELITKANIELED